MSETPHDVQRVHEAEIPVTTRSLNQMKKEKPYRTRARSRREQRDTLLGWRAVFGPWKPSLPCIITLKRMAYSSGLDDDNLAGSLKAVRDTIAAILGVDDRDKRITWRYDQGRSSVAGYFSVIVKVEEIVA